MFKKSRRMMILVAILMLVAATGRYAAAQSAMIAATPPMGWNSWNKFACDVTADDVRAAADAIAGNGMKEAGYTYVNIDDCWQGKRSADGKIQANSKFPDMKGLVDYIHSKGLKAGIYSSPGPQTCAGFEGSYKHEELDAQQYAAWGFDYLKYDWCSASRVYKPELMQEVYTKMHKALEATGRPIVYSLCQYGWYRVWTWGPKVGGNLWRTTGDIEADYDRMAVIGFAQDGLEKFAGPGHWNDPDMLEVGNGRLTYDENLTHMSLWCILAAPLIAGNDLSKMSPYVLSILTNPEVVAVNQDAKGVQGHRVAEEGPLEVWAKPLADGSMAVGLFNRGGTQDPMTVNFSDLGFSGQIMLRDLWNHKDLGSFQDHFTVEVPRHGVVLLKVRP
jgi:alpha-galactosidase